MANQKNQGSNEENKVTPTGSQGSTGRGKPTGTTGGNVSTGNFSVTSSSSPTSSVSGAGKGSTGAGSTGSGSSGNTGTSGTGATGFGSGASGSGSSSTGGTLSKGTSSTAGGSGSGSAAGTAPARSLIDQAKETAGQAYEVAAEKATTKLEEQKSTLSGGLASVAGSVRKVSENLRGPDVQDGISKFTAQYSEAAAGKIEGIANYFEEKSVNEMYRDVENFARRNPAVFVGGAFAVGLLLARFLKSGSSTSSRGRISGSGQGVQGIAEGGHEIPPVGA